MTSSTTGGSGSWWASFVGAARARLSQWDASRARDEAAAFDARRTRRQGASGRILRLDSDGLVRLLRPADRPLLVHHVTLGALDGMAAFARAAAGVHPRVDAVAVAWRGTHPVGDVEAGVRVALATARGTWRVLVHDGDDDLLAARLGDPPPPARTVLLDADGATLRTVRGVPDRRNARAFLDLLAEVAG